MDKVLSLADNMPLAVSLLAHLADSEGCTAVLSRWGAEKTSLISEGYDKRDNLELSISMSLSSPRIKAIPHAQKLLGLLSMLPDGLSDVELLQSKLPIDNIHGCKAALIRTALAYSDEHKRLKVLVPIREYMHKIQPPENHLIQPLLKHFQELLEFYTEYSGTQSSYGTVARIFSNYTNIQNLLQYRLEQEHLKPADSIYSICHLNKCSRTIGYGAIFLFGKIHHILHLCDHHLKAYFITELFESWRFCPVSNPETLVSQILETFNHFDDSDLKCMLFSHPLYLTLT
jgi:hypothetical protein